MKVYVTVSGSYSDFQLQGVFTEKSHAEEYAATFYDGDVQEYELNEEPVERRNWYSLYWIPRLPDRAPGVYHNANPCISRPELRDYDGNDRPTTKWHKDWYVAGVGDDKALQITGFDLDLVKKAYHDRRAEYEAQQEGIA